MKIEIYLDLETQSTRPNASIWQLGACGRLIDDDGKVVTNSHPDDNVLVTLCSNDGDNPFAGATKGHIEQSTLDWLHEHNLKPDFKTAKAFAFLDYPTDGLKGFRASVANMVEGMFVAVGLNNPFQDKPQQAVLGDRRLVTVYTWGNFDHTILETAMKEHDLEPPFHYASSCSLRDVHRFLNLPRDFRPDTSSHNALVDALALRYFHGTLQRAVTVEVNHDLLR